ncbi:5'-nucleotidase, lipoprotein e(P4) family [Epilithonimonas bovis DSM 19482]|uniref:5'-nucleotidase, lipoprotein e(P4) family n=1 Tax=Epilithonimonas bovis DSM 19482 TaxID=1121284 RepID=A0A1U7PXA1_9FLAO|nr:5'-nucleotidase, lipoprotein e(P4) family [Epilithonimonas bovis]SIT96441.1 5'-nucleotidase, lipoprotein e(P4) family [Epilithonimonas bovis DSM 19482]
MNYIKSIALLGIVTVYSCTSQQNIQNTAEKNNQLTVGGKLFTSFFQQKAAEYKALCFQAYNIATLRLDENLNNNTDKRPKAVITDIDETVLDNSPYAVHQSLLGKDYDADSWRDWTSRAIADTVAGAPKFFKYAASKNVEVFYVSNRDEKERTGTLANLKKFGLPYADDSHLILRTTASSKEERRQKLESSYHILLYIGDNLADFSNLFDHKTEAERTANTQKLASEFGKKFIVLPNPNYGDWESALYQYNYKLSPAQKEAAIKAELKNY